MASRIDLLENHLKESLGYRGSDGAVIHGYEFAAGDGLGHAELLAFADSRRHDLSTACIAVKGWPNGHDKGAVLKQLSYVGAPIAMFALPSHMEVWPVHTDSGRVGQAQRVPYQELGMYFNLRARDLSPRSLLDAKRGVKQLSFFDIDQSLESFARDATQGTLVRQFESALAQVPVEARRDHPNEVNRLAIRVLAARILQDKLPDCQALRTRDAISLLQGVKQLYPAYFQNLERDIGIVGRQVAETLYEGLCGNFTFRSLTNDMLAYFYENTLVDEHLRQQLGIYYTPRVIAERILRRLPLEDLRPEERTVFDGTCGSGNLLLAAYDRLSDLLPAQWSAELNHRYLLKHIRGLEKDPFAREVARLSLSLYNLPAGNAWRIRQGDIFRDNPLQLFGEMPYVIVGNPPFHEPRSVDGERVQKAAEVLNRYLEWLPPRGLLGIVLPLTFLHTNSSADSRERLLSTCEVLEVWHLPEESIPRSSIAIAVVLARKSSERSPDVSSRLTRVEEDIEVELGPPSRSVQPAVGYVVSQERWVSQPKSRMVSSPFESIWDRIGMQFPKAEPEFCRIRNGMQPGKEARLTHFSPEDRGERWRPVLYGNRRGNTLGPYLINWDAQEVKYMRYPSSELQFERNPEHFERSEKVVLNACRNPDNPWRLYAAIDRSRLVVTENFNYILPSQDTTVEELAALFNSMAVNAWYSSRIHLVKINLATLKQMPFPHFTDRQTERIKYLVRQITRMKLSLSNAKIKQIRQYTFELDEIVFDAYDIASAEKRQVRRWMDQFPRPGREWAGELPTSEEQEPSELYRGRTFELLGEVEDVSPTLQTVSLWIQGRGNGVEIPIPPSMPGWALHPGTAFTASVPWEQRYEENLSQLDWLGFRPLDFGYLSNEELINSLTEENA